MKLSLIKSVLIGFFISLFTFFWPYLFGTEFRVSAANYELNYSEQEKFFETDFENLSDYFNYFESIKNDYYILFVRQLNGSTYPYMYYIVKKEETEFLGGSFEIPSINYNKMVLNFYNPSKTGKFIQDYIRSFHDKVNFLNGIKEKINNDNFSTSTNSNISLTFNTYQYVLLYSNFDIKYKDTYPENFLIINGQTYSNNDSVLSYYDWSNNKEPIEFVVDSSSLDEITIYADLTNSGFVDSYKYEYTIDNYYDSWIDFTDYAFEFKKSPSHIFKYNGTYRVRIRNSVTGDIVAEDSYIIDSLEYSKFTISVKKNYMTYDGQTGSFADFLYSEKNEYYKYQYSFDGEEWFNIPLEDITKDRHYYLYVPFDGTVYGRVLDPLDNVLDSTSITFLSQEIPELPVDFNRYEIAISDLYDSENHKLNYKVIFYNSSTIVNEDHKISFWISLGGASKKIPLSILHFNNIPNKEQFLKNGVPTKYDKTNIPYYFSVPSLIVPSNYIYYGAFQIIPYLNSDDFDFSPYVGSKLIIETDLDLDIPVFNSTHAVNSNDTFFNFFQNAFNYFKDSIIAIFGDVGYLFNRLPLALRYFFIVIFGFGLFYILIRFIL